MTKNNKTQVSLWSVFCKICKDNLTPNFLLKTVFSLFTISFLFLFFNNSINKFISSKLIVDNEENYCKIGVLLWTLLLISLIFFFYKIQKRQFSYVKSLCKATLIAISLLFLKQFYPNKTWFFLYYIDFGIVFWIIGLFICALYAEMSFLNKGSQKSILLEDLPLLTNHKEGEIDKKVKNLIELIEESHFEKSFSIAVVGAWGGGKSTFLEQIKKEVQENDKKMKYISFQPYLNHAQENVTTEFFKQVSQELKKHTFHIDNDLLNYSKELVRDIVKSSFVDSTLDYIFPKSASAEALFDKINYKLERLGYKFIITIDELDRLSADEILEVLKLIRTTANFHNFIFIVAVDKHYIIETLITSNKITNHHFIDKFFQLEVYLPAVDSLDLKNMFLNLTNQYFQIDDFKNNSMKVKNDGYYSIIDIINVLREQDNLFELYITNYRDVKKLVNQFIYDSKILSDKIDIVDFVNYTLLKSKYPQIIKHLQLNHKKIFNNVQGVYYLKGKADNAFKNIEKLFPDSEKRVNDSNYTKEELNKKDFSSFDTYCLTENITKEIFLFDNLKAEDQHIVAITLIKLFGQNNKKMTHNKINVENNLHAILYQNLKRNEMSITQFEDIINLRTDIDVELSKIVNDSFKYNSFINHMERHIANSDLTSDELFFVIKLTLKLIHHFDKNNDYVLKKLLIPCIEKLSINNKDELFELLIEQTNNSKLAFYDFAFFYREVMSVIMNSGLRDINSPQDEKLNEFLIQKLNVYLEQVQNENNVGMEDFFTIYYQSTFFNDENSVIMPLFRTTFEKIIIKNKKFLSQTIDINNPLIYRYGNEKKTMSIDSKVMKLYNDNLQEYYEFLDANFDKQNIGFKEYLKFVELLIYNNKEPIPYKFESFVEAKEWLKQVDVDYNVFYNKRKFIIIESDEDLSVYIENHLLQGLDNNKFTYSRKNNKNYTFIQLENEEVEPYLNKIESVLTSKGIEYTKLTQLKETELAAENLMQNWHFKKNDNEVKIIYYA